ncbi:hypothetical protein CWE09_08285 [Aliidiomarina minuta]|uniref:Uncharacterized protein n=1 Tax=Aliidiomarina minuta TaxID=880057 RepID=A0A432W983_9GAMM|nr:tetratricopeptide repeat protein [Aliidiomarina minuta]RUO26684.1 hypothetical protein CWE09_08285 [Aliidiomarina minuta]
MSIINQTLKELDKRQQSGSQNVRPELYRAPAANWSLRILIVLLAMLLGGGVMYWVQQGVGADAVNSTAEPELSVSPVPVIPVVSEIEQEETPQESAPKAAESVPVAVVEPVATESNSKTESVAAAESPDESSAQGKMSIQRVERDAPELAERKLMQALEYLEQGQGRRAEQLLQEALTLQPGNVTARQQLAAYYYGRGFNSQAISLLREGLVLSPGNSRLLLLKARIYEASERPDDALRMMRNRTFALPEDADLLVLRAALANDAGDYETAADSYGQLLEWRPQQGSWWLGLALAKDYLDQNEAAVNAYQQALQDPNLTGDSRQFARQRLGVLQ